MVISTDVRRRPNAPTPLTRQFPCLSDKLSHLSLLLCVDRIALPFGINRLAKCKRSASWLHYKFFYQVNVSQRRDSLAKRLTLTSFGSGNRSLGPVLGEPREQSNEFKPFPKSKKRKWELMCPKWVVAPLTVLINEHNAHLTLTATLRLQEQC